MYIYLHILCNCPYNITTFIVIKIITIYTSFRHIEATCTTISRALLNHYKAHTHKKKLKVFFNNYKLCRSK